MVGALIAWAGYRAAYDAIQCAIAADGRHDPRAWHHTRDKRSAALGACVIGMRLQLLAIVSAGGR